MLCCAVGEKRFPFWWELRTGQLMCSRACVCALCKNVSSPKLNDKRSVLAARLTQTYLLAAPRTAQRALQPSRSLPKSLRPAPARIVHLSPAMSPQSGSCGFLRAGPQAVKFFRLGFERHTQSRWVLMAPSSSKCNEISSLPLMPRWLFTSREAYCCTG